MIRDATRAGRLDRWFRLSENRTTVRVEVLGGATTFLTMAYILFVQPAVLGAAGMDFGAVLVATALASALATLSMAIFANYPIALAPGMGHNFFFAFSVVIGMQVPWQVAMGAVAAGGTITTIVVTLRERLIVAIPQSLKHAIAVGIGLLIAVVGLEWAGIIVDTPGTLVGLGNLKSPPVLLSVFGLGLTAALASRGVGGAILLGIMGSLCVGLATGLVRYQGLVSLPPSIAPTLFQLDVRGALTPRMLPIVFVFFFLDLFDTVGTLVGVSEQGGFMKNGELPRARQALLTDAVGTVGGAALGTSTITSYIESATGIAAGARTGLASVVTAVLLLLSLFFYPLVRMVGGGYQVSEQLTLYPLIAPALILVGVMMMKSVRSIPWDDATEAIPAFLTIVVMPLTVSITEGIAFGFVGYALLKLVTGRAAEADWFVHLFAVLFVLRYAFLR
jgi:AGZA family xanthine/uracil permease-like MFS transporter